MKSIAPRPSASQGGFALIEGLIAILIFSLGILGLVGLQATTTQATTMAKARVDASFIASQRIAEMWIDMPNMPLQGEEDTPIDGLPEGLRTTAINGDIVTVTVSWKMPNDEDRQTYQTIARVTGN